jgi:RNA polymerase sigma factor (TIGR02999 family)
MRDLPPIRTDTTSDGDRSNAGGASSDLLPLVYDELRRLARGRLASEAYPQTLNATALVHEAWLRVSGTDHPWNSRRHFFCAAAEAMRRILIERARAKHRQKRPGDTEHVPLDECEIAAPMPDHELFAVDEALARLREEDAVAAEIVSLRCFAGLKWAEISELTGLSERDLGRQWEYARAWLHDAITEDPS